MNTLSDELTWRGFVNQTTYKDITILNNEPITFYFGVDPSADSMTIGNLAAAMMVRHFIDYGHDAILLVGGATGMIGDPDGKAQERDLLTLEQIDKNKNAIAAQYRRIFAGKKIKIVDNYDWFKDMGYLQFLRDVGKHVPMRQMLGREFVQSRLGEDGNGISYAEFSYALIQGYDFLHLHREHGVSLQLCGADQWGNSITGVDLIRRITGNESHVWSTPLVINKSTGVKFGKSEAGAVWLDAEKTSPNDFYQFWINLDDDGLEYYFGIYTLLSQNEIKTIIQEHVQDKSRRYAQKKLARCVTELVHGAAAADLCESLTLSMNGEMSLVDMTKTVYEQLVADGGVKVIQADADLVQLLVDCGLASSKSDARRLMQSGAITINGTKVTEDIVRVTHFAKNEQLNVHLAQLRRGKKRKDSVLLQLG